MALTELTWEEVSQYTPIKNNDRLPLFEHNGKYYLVIELGIASVRKTFDLNQIALDAYLGGNKTANDLGFYAQEGKWSLTKEEKHQSELEFLKNELQLVHDVSLPNNPNLFDEFPELKPIYEQWLSNK